MINKTNFFNINTLRLIKEYSDSHKYSHRQVLEKLVLVAFHNNGFLPNQFDIELNMTNADHIRDVLTDLGYPHVRDIRCFSQTVYVSITK